MSEFLTRNFKRHKNKIIVLLAALTALDILIFWQILGAPTSNQDLKIYFFDVGQGDSELVVLPGGVKVLVDGGPADAKVLERLGRTLHPTDRYIDLVMLSHPQLDHFGGLIKVLKRYRVGAFLTNSRRGTAPAFQDLEKTLEENNIKTIILAKGDKIRYENSVINLLSPNAELLESKELNDTTLVAELLSNNSRTLFTGDIGSEVENYLLNNILTSDVDILKVPHHGSKFSSSANFLQAVKPEIAVIEVGKNTYGHPTSETLSRLQGAGAKIFRTDRDRTIRLVIDGEKIRIFKENQP